MKMNFALLDGSFELLQLMFQHLVFDSPVFAWHQYYSFFIDQGSHVARLLITTQSLNECLDHDCKLKRSSNVHHQVMKRNEIQS